MTTDLFSKESLATFLGENTSFLTFSSSIGDLTTTYTVAFCFGVPMPVRLFISLIAEKFTATHSLRCEEANNEEIGRVWEWGGYTPPERFTNPYNYKPEVLKWSNLDVCARAVVAYLDANVRSKKLKADAAVEVLKNVDDAYAESFNETIAVDVLPK